MAIRRNLVNSTLPRIASPNRPDFSVTKHPQSMLVCSVRSIFAVSCLQGMPCTPMTLILHNLSRQKKYTSSSIFGLQNAHLLCCLRKQLTSNNKKSKQDLCHCSKIKFVDQATSLCVLLPVHTIQPFLAYRNLMNDRGSTTYSLPSSSLRQHNIAISIPD